MRPSNSLIVNGVSNSASFNSSVIWSNDIVRASYQVVVSSGSCVGSFRVQGSNDLATGLPPNQFNPTNWNNIGSSSIISCSVTATAQTSFLVPAFDTGYEYMRVSYVDASGGSANGLVSIRIKAMGL